MQTAMDASGEAIALEDTSEANISLAFSAARLHRRRHAAGLETEDPDLARQLSEVQVRSSVLGRDTKSKVPPAVKRQLIRRGTLEARKRSSLSTTYSPLRL